MHGAGWADGVGAGHSRARLGSAPQRGRPARRFGKTHRPEAVPVSLFNPSGAARPRDAVRQQGGNEEKQARASAAEIAVACELASLREERDNAVSSRNPPNRGPPGSPGPFSPARLRTNWIATQPERARGFTPIRWRAHSFQVDVRGRRRRNNRRSWRGRCSDPQL